MLVLLVRKSQRSLGQIIVNISISRHINFVFGLIIDEFWLPAGHDIGLLVAIIVKIDIGSFSFFVLKNIYYQFTVLIASILRSNASSSWTLRSYGTHDDEDKKDDKKSFIIKI
jgi:hypothetical protein